MLQITGGTDDDGLAVPTRLKRAESLECALSEDISSLDRKIDELRKIIDRWL